MAKCKKCGKPYSMLTADLGSGLCPECKAATNDAASTVTSAKTGGSAWWVVATVFSILDALAVLWFIYKATSVVNSASSLVREGAASAIAGQPSVQ